MNESAVPLEALNRVLREAGFLEPFGPEVARVTAGRCEIVIPYRRQFDRPGGIVNGIVIMAAADVAMWMAIMSLRGLEESWVTTQINTAFLSPACREALYCTATVHKIGRRNCYGSAECYGAVSGKLLAHYTVAYAKVPLPAA